MSRPFGAIVGLTLRAALRYRLVLVLSMALLGAVIVLPIIIRDDGTARGFTQILLTYTLTVITALLGFSTLWLACGTLAKDIDESVMQLVAVKPISRWKIWLGKWVGILLLNAGLLALSGTTLYFLMLWRAGKLPEAQQQVLRNEVLVARSAMKEKIPDLDPVVEKIFQERLKETTIAPSDRAQFREQIREQVKARFQLVPPGYGRRWQIDFGGLKDSLKDQPLYVRVKFTPSGVPVSTVDFPKSYTSLWQVGPPDSPRVMRIQKSLAADTFHEFAIPENMFDEKGILTIECNNPSEAAFLFQLDDGLEVLYRDSGFGLNFARGLGVVFCWLGLLAAIGLAAGSFLSFPVAAFFSIGVLVVGLSGGTVSQVVEEGGIFGINHETGRVDNPGLINQAALPLFRGLLSVIRLVEGFSPIDSLSMGRTISWVQLGFAFGQIIVLMGGLFAAIGIYAFSRRELATATQNG